MKHGRWTAALWALVAGCAGVAGGGGGTPDVKAPADVGLDGGAGRSDGAPAGDAAAGGDGAGRIGDASTGGGDAGLPGDGASGGADGATGGVPDGATGGATDGATADAAAVSDGGDVHGASDGVVADAQEGGDAGDAAGLGDAADAGAPWVPDPAAGHIDSVPLGQASCVSVTGGSGAKLALGIARLKEAGVTSVRSILTWAYFEPSKGAFEPGALDARVKPYTDAGIDVIGVLAFGNAWASSVPGADQFYPPDDPADFAAYVTAAIGHLGPLVTRYEIWNEQNAGYRFWKPDAKGDPVAYGTLLKAAVDAGRAACPTCQFAYGGPFFHSMLIDGHIPFLQATYAAHPDLSGSYDAMAMHPYPFYPPQAAPEGPPESFEWPFWDMVAGVRAVMDEHDAGGRPIWVTEVGWPIFAAVTEDIQAAYLVRGFLHLVANDATPVCWYTLMDHETPSTLFPAEDTFGLLTNGNDTDGVPQPKPAYHALAQLGTRFGAHHLVRDLHAAKLVPPGAWGFELAGPDGDRWWAVWTHPSPGTTSVTLPAAPLEVRGMQGELLDAGSVTLPVGALPVFARIE